MHALNRRDWIRGSLAAGAAIVGERWADAAEPAAEPIIDVHQHVNFHGRADELLLHHQRTMGVTKTILLPAGSRVERPSTNDGKWNGLGGAKVSGNEEAVAIARQYPREFYYGVNEVTDLPEARQVIEYYLKQGAVIIGEQKFKVECDSAASRILYDLAADYGVPILLHFQHNAFNLGLERFHTMLEKHPRTQFIGHAQTWWANVDKNHADQKILYPKGPVVAGGLTDRYLCDYSNMFADMSAGSGLNALLRDEPHAIEFLDRHQDKILFGSDCKDGIGHGSECSGSQTIAAIRKLAKSKSIERKILFDNANKLFRLS